MSAKVRWVYEWPHGSATPELRLGRAGDDVVVEWTGLGTVQANLDGTRREVRSSGSLTPAAVEAILEPHIAALVRHLHGGVSLHASSVARAGVAIAFLGASCAGKSTIAAQLCEDPEVALVADDTAALQFDSAEVAIVPSETDHSLRPDVARTFGLDPLDQRKTNKRALRRAAGAPRLGACVVLVFDDSAALPVLRRLGGAEAFSALSLATVRFVLDDDALLRGELNRLAQVVAQAPLYELRRSRDLSKMETSAREAAQLLRSVSGRDAGERR